MGGGRGALEACAGGSVGTCSLDQRLRIAWSVRPGSRRAISNHLCPSSDTPCTITSSSARVQEDLSLRKPLPLPPPPPPPLLAGDLIRAALPSPLPRRPTSTLRAAVSAVRASPPPPVPPPPPPFVGPSAEAGPALLPPLPPLPDALMAAAPVASASVPPASDALAPQLRLTPPSRPPVLLLAVSCSLLQRLRTASSDLPGSWAAMTRHRQPSCSTPRRISSSSCGDHSLRGSAAACVCLFAAARRA